jgi:multidrug resistance efflux pump
MAGPEHQIAAPAQLPGQESAVMAADPVATSPSSRLTGAVDAVDSFHNASKTRQVLPWREIGIRLLILILAGALIVFVAREWDRWVGSAVQQSTDDAYLQADITALAAKSPGYVRSVPVQDFQRVKAGELLVEIVDDDYRAQLDQAEANLAAARTAIENIEQQKLLQESSRRRRRSERPMPISLAITSSGCARTICLRNKQAHRSSASRQSITRTEPRPPLTSTGRNWSNSANKSGCSKAR